MNQPTNSIILTMNSCKARYSFLMKERLKTDLHGLGDDESPGVPLVPGHHQGEEGEEEQEGGHCGHHWGHGQTLSRQIWIILLYGD